MRVLTTILALALSAAAHSQGYATKTVRFVSGVTPGSASDTMARILAEELSKKLGQPVIVENRPGQGAIIGTQFVKSAPADGDVPRERPGAGGLHPVRRQELEMLREAYRCLPHLDRATIRGRRAAREALIAAAPQHSSFPRVHSEELLGDNPKRLFGF